MHGVPVPDAAGAPAALRVRRLGKRFGDFVALADVDLDVRPGELLCLLGPSGCGKTTLLRIIAGLETQTAGQIEQSGRDVSALPPHRRDYGIVFQSYALFPNLTVAENVGYGLVNRRLGRAAIAERVAELLRLVGLPDAAAKYPAQLSGGQQQRVALARALAPRPGLLLLDEPLSALDALERVRLRGEIRRLQQQVGVTTVLVTHDQEEALSIADRVVVMNRGRIEQVGAPQEIYERPATRFVADFVGKATVLEATVVAPGRYRVGELELTAALPQDDSAGAAMPPGARVRLYLRPEDRVVDGPLAGLPNLVSGAIEKVEFLGGQCLAEVSVGGLNGHRIAVQLSLSQMRDRGLAPGARLEFALRPERIRVFGESAA
ncbi:MAG TPA: putative 2-aminoethylphosphonate ABC transporter ATP-binding protein [Burkholderiaceae bacterium]|nr:putative 2-aminoethylphosphonate ABC transporter ATP-binding protein [Burkholderiaceae bacterium]